ncbi:hypothetical protein D9M68_834850 [compost metagenome]
MPRASMTPSKRPPASAPPMLPKPPSVMTMSAVMVYGSPIEGEMVYDIEIRQPATPERPRPMPNMSGCRRCVLMPMSCAPVGDCMSARTPLPSSVVRMSTMSAPENSRASANTSSLLPANWAVPSGSGICTGSVRKS